MIVDLVLGLFVGSISTLLGLLPTFSLPSWAGPGGTIASGAASLGTSASGLANWFPISTATTVAGVVLALVPVAIAIALTRTLISMVTGGGGAS